jgi:hypothetical protein
MLSEAEINDLAGRFEEEYPGEHETEKDLIDEFRSANSISKDEIKEVIRWKLGNQGGRIKTNIERVESFPDESLELITEAAFTHMDESGYSGAKEQVKILRTISGIGPATATVILTFKNPQDYGVGDRYVNYEVLGEKKGVTPSLYVKLLKRLRKERPSENIDIRTIEKAYWQKHVSENK